MIVTIGAFDGFHQGHAGLLARARELDGAHGAEWGAVTFHPHPGILMGALKGTLFTSCERELLRRVLGVPHLFILRFDQALKQLSPEDFWERLKTVFRANGFEIGGVVMGRDFRFGLGQAGTAETLEALCREEGLAASIVDLLSRGGRRYSSTEVRAAVAAGEVRPAREALGYPWFLWSRVGHGDRRGRTLGFPTANLELPGGKLLPALGVYAAAVALPAPFPGGGGGKTAWRPGALSIGDNPTFKDDHRIRAEVFVLDFEGDLYGANLPVLLLDRLRSVRPFPDAPALARQIKRDAAQCRDVYEAYQKERATVLASFASALEDMPPFTPDIWRLV